MFLAVLCLAAARHSQAQVIESAGSRALGMGGAFVAVANDSSSTWWNPAGQAAGPFLDVSIGRSIDTIGGAAPPASRQRVTWLALTTPPAGVSYYRFRVTDAGPAGAKGQPPANRQDGQTGVPVRSLPASQLGVTVVQTLISGVHAGTTLKYVRGTDRIGVEAADLSAERALDRGDDYGGGDTRGGFDLDVGLLATAGPVRAGAVVRNVRALDLGADGRDVRLPRQVRVGAAYDGDAIGRMPLVVAIDADLRAYDTATGARRVVAVGVERWLLSRRLGLRGGLRQNTSGAEERAASAGVSAAVRSGLFVDAHVVRGGGDDDEGWGVAARVSF